MLRSRPLLTVLLALGPSACLQLNSTALERPEADPPIVLDAGNDGTAPAPDAARDQAAPPDAGGDSATPVSPDVTTTECTPRELGCTTDGKARVCNEQGKWGMGMTCPAQTACNAGVCLCPGACAEEPPLFQTATSGLVEDLAGGGSQLYLAVNGFQASIRRFDLMSKKETVVKSAGADVATFGLDSDATGNLLWCSDVRLTSGTRTGQLVYGTQQLETGPCTHLRRRGNQVYFLGELLYRKPLDAAAARETVTTEPMNTFEIAGDFLYFIFADKKPEAFLKRFPLNDPTKVETLLRTPDTAYFRLLPDSSHVYLINDGQILRVPQTGAAQAEVFWKDAGADAWALAQTDTHVYWSTSTASGTSACSEAQIMRQAKSGGQPVVLSRSPGYCGGQLIRVDNQLYTVVWVGPPATTPARILRIRL